MARPSRLRIVALAAFCVAIGFAAGSLIPRAAPVAPPQRAQADEPTSRQVPRAGRAMFSPDIRNDAYVRSEQRKVVEMLERQCRDTGKDCALAARAREALAKE